MLQNSLTLPKKTNGWTLKRWFHKGDVPFKKFGDFWRPAVGFRAWPHPIFAAIFSNSRASMLMIFPQKKHVSTRFLHIFIPNSRSFSHFIVHSEVDFFGRGRKPCFFDPPILPEGFFVSKRRCSKVARARKSSSTIVSVFPWLPPQAVSKGVLPFRSWTRE